VLQPPAFVNQYAAMPSLHVGWDLVLGMSVVAAAGTVLLRTIGRLMPVVMAAATVLTANHYILDVLAGAAFGLAGWMVALWLERRREASTPAPARAGPPADSQRAAAGLDGPARSEAGPATDPRVPSPRAPDRGPTVRGGDGPLRATGRRCSSGR
jgi:hypothetical protein